MTKHITNQAAIEHLEKGDQVQIASGMGGIFTCKMIGWSSPERNEASVIIQCKGSDFHGLRRTVNKSELGITVIDKDTMHGTEAVSVRDASGRQHIAFKTPHDFVTQAIIPEVSPYRDKDILKKGLAAAVLARHYVRESESFIKQRQPQANTVDLDRFISQIEQGTWVAPERVEKAVRDAGGRHDLTFWIDAEQVGPVPPTWLNQCIADLYVATQTAGMELNTEPANQDYQEDPIRNQKGLKEAVNLAMLYMDQRNYGDELEIRSSSEHNVGFVLAGDLLLIVEEDCWHKEFLRPWCKVNEQWLDEKRIHFENTHLPSEFLETAKDPLVPNEVNRPSLS